MYTFTGYYGYYTEEDVINCVAEKDFFVHCCGRYKLVTLPCMTTKRHNGAKNYQLLYLAEGSAHFLINGKLEKIDKGTAILYRPGEPQYYYYLLEEHPDVYWVHFTCQEDNPFLQKVQFNQSGLYQVGIHDSFRTLYTKIIQELQHKDIYFEDNISLLIQELLLLMFRHRNHNKNSNQSYDQAMEDAIDIFNLHSHENFIIKQYVKEHNLNYYRFIDSFTKYTGVSPKQYIINIRMSKAKELLSNSAFQVAEVSNLIGYENPLYFSRLFKKTTGMSPTFYRKHIQ